MDKILAPRLIAVGVGSIRFPITILALGGSFYGFVNGHTMLAIVGALACALGLAPPKEAKCTIRGISTYAGLAMFVSRHSVFGRLTSSRRR